MWQRYNQTGHIFEKSVDNGATWVPLPLNGAIITEGPINIYATGSSFNAGSSISNALEITGSSPTMISLVEHTAAPNNKRWRMFLYGGTFNIDCVDDAITGVQSAPLVLHRDGNMTIQGAIVSQGQLVALRGINNNFTAPQNINTPDIAELQLNQTNGTNFRLISYQNSFWVYPHLRVDTLGNLVMQGAIFEYARTTPQGVWTTGNLANYAMPGITGEIKWAVVGKTMFLVTIMTIALPASSPYLWVNIPGGFQSAYPAGHVMPFQYYAGVKWLPEGITIPNGPTQILCYADGQVAWGGAGTSYYATINLTIPLL